MAQPRRKTSRRLSASFETIKTNASFALVTAAAGLLLGGCSRSKTPLPVSPVVTVLCYHTFDSAKKTPFTVSTKRFAEQLRFLSVQRIPVLPLEQVVKAIHEGGSLPERSVVITIDDGYRTALTKAYPLLKRYHFPFTLYIYPQAISRHPSALTWDEVDELAKSGVDIQSHSYTHPLLTHPPHAMGRPEYVRWLDHELRDSKTTLESHLKKPVTALAYPFGGYDELVVERAKAAGYASATTCDEANISLDVDLLRMNRRLVYRTTKWKTFVGYLKARPMKVVDLSPRDGERLRKEPREISGRIANVGEILPETASIFVDKLGGHGMPVRVDPRTGAWHLKLPETIRHGYYFVSLTARDRQAPTAWREATWLFIIARNASK